MRTNSAGFKIKIFRTCGKGRPCRVKQKEMKKTIGKTSLEITCDCPYCGSYLYITDQAREVLDSDLRANDIELQVTCEDCGEPFEVTEIIY